MEANSATFSLMTVSIEVIPASSKFSKYLNIFNELSHSASELYAVTSGVSGHNGFTVLKAMEMFTTLVKFGSR